MSETNVPAMAGEAIPPEPPMADAAPIAPAEASGPLPAVGDRALLADGTTIGVRAVRRGPDGVTLMNDDGFWRDGAGAMILAD